MKRETTNKIRYVLEEIIPPAIRDSHSFRWLFRQHWGQLIDDIERFRINAHHVDQEEYSDIYSAMPRIQEGTDNSDECVARVTEDILSGSVLDVGCGTGELAANLAPFVSQVIGVDSSAEMLEAARDRLVAHPNVELRRGQLERLPLENESVDAITVCLVLHHVPDPTSVFAEIARVLRPGGKALLVDMQRHDRSEYHQQMGHIWLGFAEEEIRSWFADANLESIHIHPIPPDPKAKGPSLFAAIARRGRDGTLH